MTKRAHSPIHLRETLFILLLAFFALPLCAATTSKTDVQVRQIDDSHFELVMTTNETTDVTEAQHGLMLGAQELCKAKSVKFGHYKFELNEPLKSTSGGEKILVLTQNIECSSTSLVKVDAENPVDQKWEPSEQDQLKIKLLSYQYFQAKDNSDYKTAFESFSKDMASAIDFNNWKSNLIKFYGIAGTLKSRTPTRITWYNNPANASVSGIFAAVDYSSTFANINIHCGYLMWHKKDDGNFELIREEQNYLDTTTQKKLSESEITDIKAKFGCRES